MDALFSNKYQELARLGQGGMGVVYKVRHTTLDTIFALKVLPAHLMENQDLVERFYREARMMARLKHTNIVRVIDIDRDESRGLYYFVMEYIQGRVLKQYIRDLGPLPLPDALEIGCQIARALVYAHRQTPPVIHRDIKPENIMIEEPQRRVVVLDFGIAKQLEAGSQFTVTGTPKYCAPEQFLGKPITGSADVYSLGLVLYEMITGTQFFAGLDNNAIFAQAFHSTQEYQVNFPASVPPALSTVIRKAVAKSVEQRYPTMLDFIKDLETQRRELREPATMILSTENSAVRQPDNENAVRADDAGAAASSPSDQGEPQAFATEGRKPVQPRFYPRIEQEPARPLHKEIGLFTADGKLSRTRFTSAAFRSLVATTGESRGVGDTQVAVFHLLLSLTRGSYLAQFYQYVSGYTGEDLDAKVKMLRARIRQAYRRPVVEEKLIVRELQDSDLKTAMRTLLETAAILAGQSPIEERHLLAALLEDVPVDLRAVLQESGMTLAKLRRYTEEKR